jgi:hypothetical protein
MANNFGRVNVSVTASTGGLTAGLSKAGKALRGFSSGVSAVTSPFSALGAIAKSTFGQLALFTGVSGAISSLTGMASAASENVDQLSKLSRRLGTTYSELAGLKLAGDLAGVGIETIATAMTKADVALVKAQNGSKQANAAFATLGLTTEQLGGLSAADRFEAIASSIAKLPSEAERSAAAIALFGRAGAGLLPLFEGGAQGIRQAREEAERFGLTLTNAQGRNVEEMNDSFTRVGSSIQGIIQQVTAHLAPAITSIAKQFTDFVGSVGGANIGQAIGEALLEGADYLAQVGDYIISNFGPTLSGVVQYLSQAASQWNVSFSLGERVANLFLSAFTFLQFVGNLLSTSISFLLQKMLQTAADIADYIPGFGSVAEANRQAASAMGDVYQRSLAEADKNFAAAGEAFNKSLSSGTTSTGQAIAEGAIGPLQGFVRQARDVARAAAAGKDKSVAGLAGQQKPAVASVVRISSADLNAIVSGTQGEESFRNALARGADPRLETKEDAKRAADAGERAADGIEELVRTGMIGVAAIA